MHQLKKYLVDWLVCRYVPKSHSRISLPYFLNSYLNFIKLAKFLLLILSILIFQLSFLFSLIFHLIIHVISYWSFFINYFLITCVSEDSSIIILKKKSIWTNSYSKLTLLILFSKNFCFLIAVIMLLLDPTIAYLVSNSISFKSN